MAEKILKTRKQITSTLRTDLFLKLREMSEETDIPISKLLDRALDKFFNETQKVPPNEY